MKRECKSEFKNYKSSNTRLDEFLLGKIDEDKAELKKVIILVLTLSHGHSDIERGFSVNSDMEVENLKEENLVAMKMVHSELQTSPNIVDYPITPELMRSCKGTRQHYQQHLEDQKKKEVETNKQRKRKAVQTVNRG